LKEGRKKRREGKRKGRREGGKAFSHSNKNMTTGARVVHAVCSQPLVEKKLLMAVKLFYPNRQVLLGNDKYVTLDQMCAKRKSSKTVNIP